MFFPIAGVVSQFIPSAVNGNIGIAITAFLSQAVEREVNSSLYGSYIGTFETEGTEVNSLLTTYDLQLTPYVAAPAERELAFTNSFVDLALVEAADSLLLGIIPANELTTTEPLSNEIYGNVLDVTEIENIEPVQRELQSLPTTYYLIPITLKTEFLPGSPGYVAGIPGTAVELIGVEVGRIPLPLPAGKPKKAAELLKAEATQSEIHSSLSTNYFLIPTLEIAANQKLNGKAIALNEISRIEIVDRELQFLLPTSYFLLPTLKPATAKLSSTISATEISGFEVSQIWLNEQPLEVKEISMMQKSDRELQQLPVTNYEFLITYAAVSLITKP